MARPKTYIIKLSDDERAALQKTIRNKKTCKTVLKRCQILLELDEEQPGLPIPRLPAVMQSALPL